MPTTVLDDRGVVRVSGEDARDFLQRVVTMNMMAVAPDSAGFGALLTPQGKILADFIVLEQDGVFWLDCPLAHAGDLAKRLSMYRLRAKANVEDVSATHGVAALWGEPSQAGPTVANDPRDPALGSRIVAEKPELAAFGEKWASYEAHRIALGVPKGGADFAYGDAFPHEANMDLLHGLDFRKGCYVGQEVVSRVEHRRLARKRICRVRHPGAALPKGVRILAGEREIGETGSGVVGLSLATIRLDRLEEAKAAGVEIRFETGAIVDAVIPPG